MKEQIISIDSKNELSWRYTPWDSTSLKRKTAEITSIKFSSLKNGTDLVLSFEKKCFAKLIYTRLNGDDFKGKKLFHNLKYFQCENSLNIYSSDIKNYEAPLFLKNKKINLEEATQDDYKNIVEESLAMYKYSRFHEDPLVPTELSNFRMANWSKDLIDKDTPNLISKNLDGTLNSYIFYQEKAGTVDLILGGSVLGKGAYSLPFFNSILLSFKEKGIKKVRTKVSAANKGILSLYIALGFNVSKAEIDFHKHLD
jgi:hypothetical protein